MTNIVHQSERIKKSMYNFFIPKEDNSYLVFNSATGVILHVFEKEELEKLKALINNDTIINNSDDKMISTFYTKGILVPEQRNEYQFIKYCYERDIIKNNTLALTLITTRQCNLRCVYCYEKHENKAMSKELYSSILKYIENSLENRVYNGVNIELFGGEPFIEYNNIIEFLSKTKSLCERYKVYYGAGATTNGALIYPDRFDKLIKLGCKRYQITIDGFADTHDKYRISADSNGSFDKIISNLKYMNSTDYDFKITIRTNFNEEIFKQANEFYSFIKDNFDKRFSVYYEGIKKLGGINDDNLNTLEKTDVDKSSVDIAKTLKKLNLHNDVVDSMTRPYSCICYASKHNNFLIDYDGTILKCTLSLDDDLNKIGYIDDSGIMHINSERHSKWVGAKIDIAETCKTCRVFPICFGGRCVNGRVHGKRYMCNSEVEEKNLEELISTFV